MQKSSFRNYLPVESGPPSFPEGEPNPYRLDISGSVIEVTFRDWVTGLSKECRRCILERTRYDPEKCGRDWEDEGEVRLHFGCGSDSVDVMNWLNTLNTRERRI
jgi:hypothetical protein